MTMNCCLNEPATDVDKSDEMLGNEISASCCRNCLGHGRPVSRKTVLLMLKPELLEQAWLGDGCRGVATPPNSFRVATTYTFDEKLVFLTEFLHRRCSLIPAQGFALKPWAPRQHTSG